MPIADNQLIGCEGRVLLKTLNASKFMKMKNTRVWLDDFKILGRWA